jgi:acetyl-CoA acetyltransferase
MNDFGDVVVCAPVTVPYVRRSDKGAAWWLGSALRRLLETSGLAKRQVDGLCLSSFTLAPDGPAPFVQYVGLSPRFLEFLPTGGACGIMALRRAARAVQCGDADVVACIAGDTNGADSFHDLLAQFSSFSRDCVWPYGAGGPNESFALLTEHAMRRTGATRADFGKLCVAQRKWAQRNPLALLRGELTLETYLAARPIASPLHLLDCVIAVRRCRWLPGNAAGAGRGAGTALRAHPRDDRTAQCFSGRSDPVARRLGDGRRCALGPSRYRA